MPMPTDHVARISLSEEAYVRIQAAILEGALEPGERLRDPELAAWLGISRTPIRHALDRLAEQGLVEMERNRYTRVAVWDISGVLEALQVLGDLWAGAALHGVPRWEADDLALVGEILTTLDTTVEQDDVVRFATVLEHLVVTYTQLEGNSVRMQALGNVLPRVRRLARKLRGRLEVESAETFSAALLTAARERDGRASARLIIGWIRRLEGILEAL